LSASSASPFFGGCADGVNRFILVRSRKFRLYFAGSVTSDFGTWLQNTAQVLLAYRADTFGAHRGPCHVRAGW
jgi:hypothetical protein